MSNVFEFVATSREESGKSAARATRRQGDVPAIIYGGDTAPAMMLLNHNDVVKHLDNEAVYSHVLDISIDGKTEKAVLKGVQRHPAKFQILHLDFMRINETEQLRMHVPLHFINESTSVGVKKGGVATHARVEVEVICLPSALPEYLEIDLENIDLGGSVHLSEISLPEGVEIVELTHGEGHDIAVVSIIESRVSKADLAEDAGEEEGEAPAAE
ncbi:MAG: 50S ribosomal protein L25/general stress protein Ctc [Methylococcaceae bacterium]|nr:50S ribosomal protein L25/general stress protein Ctc [Methylococcaceae bacterium]